METEAGMELAEVEIKIPVDVKEVVRVLEKVAEEETEQEERGNKMLKLILNKILWLIVSVKMWCLITSTILLMSGYLNAVCFTKIWVVIIATKEIMKKRNLSAFLKKFKKKNATKKKLKKGK